MIRGFENGLMKRISGHEGASQFHLNDYEIRTNEKGGTYNTHGTGEKFLQNLVTKPERKKLGDLSVDGSIMLKGILKTWGLKIWVGFIWLRIRTTGGIL